MVGPVHRIEVFREAGSWRHGDGKIAWKWGIIPHRIPPKLICSTVYNEEGNVVEWEEYRDNGYEEKGKRVYKPGELYDETVTVTRKGDKRNPYEHDEENVISGTTRTETKTCKNGTVNKRMEECDPHENQSRAGRVAAYQSRINSSEDKLAWGDDVVTLEYDGGRKAVEWRNYLYALHDSPHGVLLGGRPDTRETVLKSVFTPEEYIPNPHFQDCIEIVQDYHPDGNATKLRLKNEPCKERWISTYKFDSAPGNNRLNEGNWVERRLYKLSTEQGEIRLELAEVNRRKISYFES